MTHFYLTLLCRRCEDESELAVPLEALSGQLLGQAQSHSGQLLGQAQSHSGQLLGQAQSHSDSLTVAKVTTMIVEHRAKSDSLCSWFYLSYVPPTIW